MKSKTKNKTKAECDKCRLPCQVREQIAPKLEGTIIFKDKEKVNWKELKKKVKADK
jgi:hypothetical protein